ncbi:hypothetical protein BV20DRAFT_676938 [Pilatotrama ljubarskyi]|nr:hypothetical protein BV20DRAFT_676938 [Pilatotrama ljubarskyi]
MSSDTARSIFVQGLVACSSLVLWADRNWQDVKTRLRNSSGWNLIILRWTSALLGDSVKQFRTWISCISRRSRIACALN